ncbi:exonuclease SbcCD subunit D [Listeria fleischmannii]|uniref:exonuclease SbcCD subunit D n=1 Tax=Listeria fleischmannii TaxID=1069827 RepID=UPI0016251C58|nr:exonuclease SbcCD subunit D [Listeria fleischmannii]MBC1418406.1 exonuclease SbcCD subunit D [Listeria fleischmannii]
MKLLHTADLHLGKIVSGVSMLEDQAYILNQITEIIKKEQVDGIIVAGDLYDRSVPPASAVLLLNDIFYEWNVTLGLPIFAISGNHDSAERLQFGSAWYEKSSLYLAGKMTDPIQKVSFQDAEIWLVPFHEPATVRKLFQDETVRTYEEAMQKITDTIRARADQTKTQILVGHAFVSGGIPSDSERSLAIGNVDRVSTKCFADFDYVALGHLHHPHAITHPTIHYSGSPLKYSFSESKDKKSVRIVTLQEKNCDVREVFLKPMRDMRIVSGSLEELTTTILDKKEDYLQVKLTDAHALLDPMGQLRKFYPNILHLERVRHQMETDRDVKFEDLMKKEDVALFDQFFEFANGQKMTTAQREKMELIFKEAREGGQG